MSTLPKEIDPEAMRSEVNQMTETAGWMHYCAAFERRLNEIERKILDGRTGDAEANVLRRAREQIVLLRPEAVALDLMQGATNEIKRLTRSN